MTRVEILWRLVEDTARENAYHTEAEGYTLADKTEHTAKWAYWVAQSARSIIDSLTSYKECRDLGLTKPITTKQAAALLALVVQHYETNWS